MKEQREILKQRLESYRELLDSHKNMIIAHNYIVRVNELYTLGVDNDNKVIEEHCDYPTQFTQECAQNIINGINITDNDGSIIKPVAIFFKDWYREQIVEMERTLKLIENL